MWYICRYGWCNSILYGGVSYLNRYTPDNKVPGANMEPCWALSAPNGPLVGPMNLAIRDTIRMFLKLLPAGSPSPGQKSVVEDIILSEVSNNDVYPWYGINTLRSRQNIRHFADDIFKCIFVNENVWISIKISLKFVPKGPINNIPASVQIMAWRLPDGKPLSGPRLVKVPTHICVTRSQWVKSESLSILFDK